MQSREQYYQNIRTAYERVCNEHDKIADFRAKLLGLLPLASGAGIFLLVNEEGISEISYLLPVGLFGGLVTLGLFFYELRGIQKCTTLIDCAKILEKKILPRSMSYYGAFSSRPKGLFCGWVGAKGAALMIYPTVFGGWIYIAILGCKCECENFAIWFPILSFFIFLIIGLGILFLQKKFDLN